MEFDYKFRDAVLEIGKNSKMLLASNVYIMINKNRKKNNEKRVVIVSQREFRNLMTGFIYGYELIISDLMTDEVLLFRKSKKKWEMSNVSIGDDTYKFKTALEDKFKSRIPMYAYFKLYYDLNNIPVSNREYDIKYLSLADNKVKLK